MAEFLPAVQLTLQNEGGFFHNPVTGEIVNYGVTLAFACGNGYCSANDEDFIKDLTQDQAITIYQKHFWEPHNFGLFEDQNLANKAFDLTVNMGPGDKEVDGALTLLQRAVCDCGGKCGIDGLIGPQSVAAINTLNAVQLLTAYRARAKARYEQIAKNPKLAPDLPAWLARLAK
jgi:type VI secretion system secreted protein VgrG